MQPEKRLLLSVLLLAVAQQDQANVKYVPTKKKPSVVLDAALFVRSQAFIELARLIEIEPTRLRKLRPHQALAAFDKLLSDHWREAGVEKELDEFA